MYSRTLRLVNVASQALRASQSNAKYMPKICIEDIPPIGCISSPHSCLLAHSGASQVSSALLRLHVDTSTANKEKEFGLSYCDARKCGEERRVARVGAAVLPCGRMELA
ncbi:unnamed protein product [Taenia asiatica]|uniref:Uncharacterized protein n=1 Tax=Taenia asiatica TaxID=60517 RepID=A0A0R3VX86_TAEAS|nr:unnamed protein product [Taenia asiatica]